MSNFSINATNCIVKNKEFEVKPYKSTANYDNIVLPGKDLLEPFANYNYSYKLVKTDIDVVWKDEKITFTYKDQTLLTIKDPHIQSVAEYLNKFNNISKKELNKLLEEAQNKTKSKLEQEIEELEAEKQALEDKMEIYRQIQSKKDEIKDLMQQLEEE